MEKGYGRWLAWLQGKGWLDPEIAPGDRITLDRVRAYAADLEKQNASGTVIARLIELKIVATIMDPARDWSWVYRMASSIRARHKPAGQVTLEPSNLPSNFGGAVGLQIIGPMPSATCWDRGFADSPLEGSGFELLVPRERFTV